MQNMYYGIGYRKKGKLDLGMLNRVLMGHSS